MEQKERILIVDDSEMNRDLLSEMLSDEFTILEAKDGAEAVALLQTQGSSVSLVLLDMIMPVMNGLEVLEIMNKNGWLADIPVIMISSEDGEAFVQKAYELGVTEYIRRPFDVVVVKRRCKNVVMLYSKQKKLVGIVADQFYENEKNSRLMIGILAHIVEFRNGESGLHVVNVQNYTEILLRQLVKESDKYDLSERDITQISNISALHDIGKITIPDEILNKPGRLTPEEFAIMKTHAAAGSQILSNLEFYKDEPIVKLAYEIARWHHERYDGRGYPDGLKGEEIPISAQVVSIADVYDALTADRVYKKAFSHDTAIEMITKGECGAFNPLLIDCLLKCQAEMSSVKEKGASNLRGEEEIKDFARDLLRNDALYSADGLLVMLEYERMKNRFFESITGGLSFEYNAASDVLTFSKNASEMLGLPLSVVDPIHDEGIIAIFGQNTLTEMSARLRAAYPEYPVVEFNLDHIVTSAADGRRAMEVFRIYFSDDVAERRFPAGSQQNAYKLVCRTTWTLEEPQRYTGVIGKVVPLMNDYGLMKGVSSNDTGSLL